VGEFLGGFGLQLMHLVLPSLATILSGLIIALATKQLQKLGIQVTNEQDARLRQLARDAIMTAEEMAHRHPELTGVEKNAIATNQVVSREPTINVATAARVIDQQLPLVRKELEQSPTPSTPTEEGMNVQSTTRATDA
jgi:hypothetical protein